MGRLLLEKCGPLAAPQILLSVITVALIVGYLVALKRREVADGAEPWNRTLEPLAGIATTVGLLGSVAGFIVAFSGFQDGLNVDRLTQGLSAAYWTTGVGIVTSLFASIGAYALSLIHRRHRSA